MLDNFLVTWFKAITDILICIFTSSFAIGIIACLMFFCALHFILSLTRF